MIEPFQKGCIFKGGKFIPEDRGQMNKTFPACQRVAEFPARRTPASQTMGASCQDSSIRFSQNGLGIMEAYLAYNQNKCQVSRVS